MKLDISIELLLAIISITSTIIVLIIVTMSRIKDKASYNESLKRIELDSIRNSYERKIYDLNNRLTLTEKKWKDVNHLILSSQANYSTPLSEENKAVESPFLFSAGLSKEDFVIDNKLVFVLTPFHEEYTGVYKCILDICLKNGLQCQRGDEDFVQSDLLTHILKQIVKASLIIANVNGRNPNVFYELGIAHAINKPTIIIAKSPNDLEFDLKSKRIIFYEKLTQEKFMDDLKDEIIKIKSV